LILNIETKHQNKLAFFQDNILPGLPWFQWWTNIILKKTDAIKIDLLVFGVQEARNS